MADDQTPQDPQVPVSTTDQSASSDTNRPDSTTLADPSQSATTDDRPISTNLADPTTTSADSIIPTSDSPSVPIEPVSFTPSEVAGTISADSTIPSPPDQSANTDNHSKTAVSTDLSQVTTDLPPVSVSPTVPSVEDVPPAPILEETFSTAQNPISVSSITSPPDLSDSTNLSNPSPINVNHPEIKPVEVQSDAPDSTPTIIQSQQATESASIKPEPPESPQNAPLADTKSSDSSPTSFGDLLSDNTNPTQVSPTFDSSSPNLSNLSTPSDLPVSSSNNSSPTTNNPFTSPKPDVYGEGGQPSSGFGDLIKDIKPEESVIQPPPVSSVPVSPPVISSSNPQSTTQNPQPISPQSPLPAEASAQEGASPISPISPNLSVNRIKANQARVQKRNNHLNKIMELVKTKGKITNKDIRDSLRVSQSTVSDYLHALVKSGKIKKEGKGKAIVYTL